MNNTKILYKPDSKCIPVKIHGVTYISTLNSPKVFVVDNINKVNRSKDLKLTEDFNNSEIIHDLYDCVYTEINKELHIECRHWKSEYKEK